VTPFKDKEGVFFKVASFDAFNDIGPAIHSISCAVFASTRNTLENQIY
jgi:hypothetical protein